LKKLQKIIKMETLCYFLLISGGLILVEIATIITLNTKRGYWESTNKFHVLSLIFFLVYLGMVIYSSEYCNRSEYYCELS